MSTNKHFRVGLLALMVAAPAFAPSAFAHQQGDWLIRAGYTNVDPKSDNNPVVSVDDDWSFTANFTYMYSSNLAFELLVALPFEHDVILNGTGETVGRVDHLPPTFSVQWHFLPDAMIQPYVGAGLNITLFSDEQTFGSLAGSQLKLDDSFGYAFQAGIDVPIGETWFLNADVRYIDIESDATVDGVDLGSIDIDPWVYGVNVGWRF